MDIDPFLNTVQGEISLFRWITRARPVGLHKHFHLLAILNNIKLETGQSIHPDEVWTKLKTLYNLDALDALEMEEDEIDDNANYQSHSFFESEFSLPYNQFEHLIAPRRLDAATGSGHSRTDSGASAFATPARKVSTTNLPAFDSDGELTEEDENKGELDEGGTTGEDQDAAESSSPRGRRKRSRSIRTRSEGQSVPPEDTEMAEPEASPAPSITGSRQSRRASTVKQKKPPPPPPRKGPSGSTRKKKK